MEWMDGWKTNRLFSLTHNTGKKKFCDDDFPYIIFSYYVFKSFFLFFMYAIGTFFYSPPPLYFLLFSNVDVFGVLRLFECRRRRHIMMMESSAKKRVTPKKTNKKCATRFFFLYFLLSFFYSDSPPPSSLSISISSHIFFLCRSFFFSFTLLTIISLSLPHLHTYLYIYRTFFFVKELICLVSCNMFFTFLFLLFD